MDIYGGEIRPLAAGKLGRDYADGLRAAAISLGASTGYDSVLQVQKPGCYGAENRETAAGAAAAGAIWCLGRLLIGFYDFCGESGDFVGSPCLRTIGSQLGVIAALETSANADFIPNTAAGDLLGRPPP